MEGGGDIDIAHSRPANKRHDNTQVQIAEFPLRSSLFVYSECIALYMSRPWRVVNVLVHGTEQHKLKAGEAVPVVSGIVSGASLGLSHLTAILVLEHKLDAAKMAARGVSPQVGAMDSNGEKRQ